MLIAHRIGHLLRVRAHVGAAGVGVRERMRHRGADRGFGGRRRRRIEIGARADAGQRHRQAGVRFPPVAEVDDLHEAVILIGEAALVDDEPGVDVAVAHRGEDAVVAHLDDLAE